MITRDITRTHPGAARSAAAQELLESRGDYERCRKQVLEDLADMDPEYFVALEGSRLITVSALIEAIKENNEMGERHVRSYMSALDRLHEHRRALGISR